MNSRHKEHDGNACFTHIYIQWKYLYLGSTAMLSKSIAFQSLNCTTFICLADNFQPQTKCAYFFANISHCQNTSFQFFFFFISVETYTQLLYPYRQPRAFLRSTHIFSSSSFTSYFFFHSLHLFFLLLIRLKLNLFFLTFLIQLHERTLLNAFDFE